jgi:flagellar biogenesis protein FliO
VTPALLLLQAAPPAADSYLADFLRTLLALAGVCGVAWFGLRSLARRGYRGADKASATAVRVLARVPLETRKSLYLVRAGERVLLIGTGDAGPPALIAELDPASVAGSDASHAAHASARADVASGTADSGAAPRRPGASGS